jgi:hypothetical protein
MTVAPDAKNVPETVHMVTIDRLGSNETWDCDQDEVPGFDQLSCSKEYWLRHFLHNPRVKMIPCKIAAMCGLDISMYVKKYKKGFNKYYREGGSEAVMRAIYSNQNYLLENNGSGTFLTIDPESGLSEWQICGKLYIVCNGGSYPLTVGEVWGLKEMVKCVMNHFDLSPQPMSHGRCILRNWANQYQARIWMPTDGTRGIEIYGSERERVEREIRRKITCDLEQIVTKT